jgi:hypothetical protein
MGLKDLERLYRPERALKPGETQRLLKETLAKRNGGVTDSGETSRDTVTSLAHVRRLGRNNSKK